MQPPTWFSLMVLELFEDYKKMTKKEFEREMFNIFETYQMTEIKECKERIEVLEKQTSINEENIEKLIKGEEE